MPSANTNSDFSNLGPKVAAYTHALYTLFQPTWIQLAHVREGTGGFLDGTFLVAHPREWLDHTAKVTDEKGNVTTSVNPNPKVPSPKLKARRKLARYENIASAILDLKKSALFREEPTRRVGSAPKPTAKGEKKAAPVKPDKTTPLEQWWEDVDGCGTNITDAMRGWWDLAGTFGHVALYLDVAPPTDEAATAADQEWPYIRAYPPLDVLDWRRDETGTLIYIKLLEAVLSEPGPEKPAVITYRIRVVDETSWTLYDYKKGGYISQGEHGLGRVPVVFLYSKRRALLTEIGESVLGDPRNYIDLYNLTSEIRELLRNQTFSFINLPLGTGPDAMSVSEAQAMMGQQTGTMNVLFSAQPAQMLTGDPANVDSYHAEIDRVRREIYRETGVQWETDNKGVEAKGSLEIKREDMNIRIAAYADECQQAEIQLAKLWYLSEYGDAGETRFEQDNVTIHYSERFTATPFDEVLKQVQAAQAIGMPAEFLKALRKAIVTKFEGMGTLSPDDLAAITDAIDNAPDDPTPAERMKQKMDILTASVKGGAPPPADAKNLDGKAA